MLPRAVERAQGMECSWYRCLHAEDMHVEMVYIRADNTRKGFAASDFCNVSGDAGEYYYQ